MQKGRIYKRGGWWMFRFKEPQIINGRKRWKDAYRKLAPVDQYASAAAVEKDGLVRNLRDSLDASKLTPNARQAITDFVEHVYFPIKEKVLKPSTVVGYKDFYNRNLKPEFTGLRMADVNLGTAQNILNTIAENNPRLSPGALKHLKWLGVAIFDFAAKRGAYNPDVQNPFRRVDIPPTKYEARPARHTDLEAVVEMIETLDEPASTVVATAAFTGLRKSELQGLRWEDFRDGRLFVERTAWRPTNVVESTKTKAAKAPVPVISILARYLQTYRKAFPSDGFIFFGPKSQRPLDLHNLASREIRPTLKRAGIEWAGWHGFRRGLSTTLYELGTDAKTRMAILRHAKIAVTDEIYTQSVDSVSRAALAKVERAFNAKRRASARVKKAER
jgi:integrase